MIHYQAGTSQRKAQFIGIGRDFQMQIGHEMNPSYDVLWNICWQSKINHTFPKHYDQMKSKIA